MEKKTKKRWKLIEQVDPSLFHLLHGCLHTFCIEQKICLFFFISNLALSWKHCLLYFKRDKQPPCFLRLIQIVRLLFFFVTLSLPSAQRKAIWSILFVLERHKKTIPSWCKILIALLLLYRQNNGNMLKFYATKESV